MLNELAPRALLQVLSNMLSVSDNILGRDMAVKWIIPMVRGSGRFEGPA